MLPGNSNGNGNGGTGEAGPVYEQVLICHYCLSAPGNTIDHIVPRAIIPKGKKLEAWLLIVNRVRACHDCNNRKGSFRADCDCPQCKMAWAAYQEHLHLAYIPNKVSLGYIKARPRKTS
jgi:hypothetical protein